MEKPEEKPGEAQKSMENDLGQGQVMSNAAGRSKSQGENMPWLFLKDLGALAL